MLNKFVNVPCQEVGVHVFFPSDEDSERFLPEETWYAKQVCKTCHQVDECLEYSMSENFEYGIFGGMTPVERRALARHEKRRKSGGQPRKKVA
jgi:WhiB family redox-sensing transcriptional regulator